jgi:hypothetical protein
MPTEPKGRNRRADVSRERPPFAQIATGAIEDVATDFDTFLS